MHVNYYPPTLNTSIINVVLFRWLKSQGDCRFCSKRCDQDNDLICVTGVIIRRLFLFNRTLKWKWERSFMPKLIKVGSFVPCWNCENCVWTWDARPLTPVSPDLHYTLCISPVMLLSCDRLIITAHNSSCGKVMFSQVSLGHSVQGG